MKDSAVRELAERAGIAVERVDYADERHCVAPDCLRRILIALGLPCESTDDLSESIRSLETRNVPPLITATVGRPVTLPFLADRIQGRVLLVHEDGSRRDLSVTSSPSGPQIAVIQTPGYHALEFNDKRITIAVAPPRCPKVAEIASDEKVYGIAAQVYGLRRHGDCGIGDAGGVIALATKAAALKADMLALSPLHAQFGAEPNHFSPYSPSSRLFYNPLHADVRCVFGEHRVHKAAAHIDAGQPTAELERQALIDWPRATRAKMALFRCMFEEFVANDLSVVHSALGDDFRKFRNAAGRLLEDHAVFEALHAHQIRENPAAWAWTEWPQPLRDPASEEVRRFAAANEKEVTFHCFLQWVADRSLAAAQRDVKRAGMRIGLVQDLAVGMSRAGSHAWSSQSDILTSLEIGAPADLYNANGQNWGLTTFAPRALVDNGFAPFIATMRACLRHAGGLRIDHAMGLLRLWVVPRGAAPTDGAYLSYPMQDLMRLTALEAQRHGAIIIGEDLGTVPLGFRDSMADKGIYGMRVLWFERGRNRYKPPGRWDVPAAAMTSTHDLPTVAGWWRGIDIERRAQAGSITNPNVERQARTKERQSLWRAFRRAGVAEGKEAGQDETPRAVDAAVKFVAATASDICLLPLEDALAFEEQPNIPGTIDEFPNWRRRYPGNASQLLDAPPVRERLHWLARRGRP
jgi:4-alpha-glucanotransferase